MKYNFEVAGIPGKKGRPKFSSRGGFMRAYTPKETVNSENNIRMAFVQKYGRVLLSEMPFILDVVAYFPIPKSVSKKKREIMVNEKTPHAKKPDKDNVEKVILDAMNGVAFKDDSQCYDGRCKKFYSESPRVEISIEFDEERLF